MTRKEKLIKIQKVLKKQANTIRYEVEYKGDGILEIWENISKAIDLLENRIKKENN